MDQRRLVLITVGVTLTVVLSLAADLRMAPKTHTLLTGEEAGSNMVVMPPYSPLVQNGVDQIVGDTLTIGTTWTENQHNGTISRMIAMDSLGYLHFTWMNGLDNGATNRHVYYNYLSPSETLGWVNGTQVDAVYRSGFSVLDVAYGGRAFIALHETQIQGGSTWSAVANDVQPHFGGFLSVEPPAYTGISAIIWPNMQWGANILHLVAQEKVETAGAPKKQFYTSAVFNTSSLALIFTPTWTQFEPSQTIAYEIAATRSSNRVAIAWTHCREAGYPGSPGQTFTQRNNDIYLVVDDDGQNLNFSNPLNVTNFIPPDPSLLPDTLRANMDTLRAYTDISALFDVNGVLHLAFTTGAYFEVQDLTYWNSSLLWHWSEDQPDSFHLIANGFNPADLVDCGGWNLKVQRPSLGQNPITGNLYCLYQTFDTDSSHLSAIGWPSGEIYVSASTDGGRNWSVGTNVTNTLTPLNAAPGQSLSEISPSLIKEVDDTCRTLYVLDRDAGDAARAEGAWTENEVKYHHVPVNDIPTTPLVIQNVPFHVEHAAAVPWAHSASHPNAWSLSQNHPNPFNATTVISYELRVASFVRLEVFDLAGRKVVGLVDERQEAGIHKAVFDGSSVPSGIYLYRIQVGESGRFWSATEKMVLLK